MWLQQIRVKQVRNLCTQTQVFAPGTHLFLGPNGAGKTNWLEAIYILLTGRSFRTHHLKEVVAHGAESACIEAQLVCRSVHYHLMIQINSSGKQLWMNDRACRDWSGLFPCSCWVPEDIELVRSGPSLRRRFLDHHLMQIDPLYGHHLARYQRALDQRSALLKLQHVPGLDAFEQQMAISASYVIQARKNSLERLELDFCKRLEHLGFAGLHGLKYETSCSDVEPIALYKLWHRAREMDMKLGQTMRGPHVDDIKISFQGHDARKYASEGQARACVAALKLSEWQSLSHQEGQALLLIDEVGMGLDSSRWAQIGKWMESWTQVFLTSPSLSSETICPTKQIWSVMQGCLQPTT